MSAVALVAGPAVLVAAGLAVLAGGRRHDRLLDASVAAGAAALVAAVAVGIAVVVDGPVTAVVTVDGTAVLGLVADRVTALLAFLVAGVNVVVQGFARRYLEGDPRAHRFFALAGLTAAATLVMVSSATLSGLIVAWVLAGLATTALLAHRAADLPAARLGVRRTRLAFAVGDAALVVAGVLVLLTIGELDLRNVGAETPTLAAERLLDLPGLPSVGAAVAVLLVVAALARSAVAPFHRWLPGTLAAPTPASALLHAGVVNAGGFLLVRLAPVFGLSPVATYLAFAAGATTAVLGTAAMVVKPDIKGALAHSTTAQMGFMIVQCAVGALGAAVMHLVAHGMFKATLFLGSGSAIGMLRRHHEAPAARPLLPAATRLAVATLLPAAALALAIVTLAPELVSSDGGVVVVLFAWLTAAHAVWGWLARPAAGAGAVLASAAVATVIAALAYVGGVRFLKDSLDPAITGLGPNAVEPWLVVAVTVALLAGAGVLAVGGGAVERWRRWAYVSVLEVGHVRGPALRTTGGCHDGR